MAFSQEKQKEIEELLIQLQSENSSPLLIVLFQKLHAGEQLTPDEWADGQEAALQHTNILNFFRRNRVLISYQLTHDNKNCIAIVIITFDDEKGSRSVLLSKSHAIHASNTVQLEWSIPAKRVSKNERQYVKKNIWDVFKQTVDQDQLKTHFLAAAIRCIKEMNIELDYYQLLENLHVINRVEAGRSEENPNYSTQHFWIHLGSIVPNKIMNNLASSKMGRITHCVPLQDFLSRIQDVPDNSDKNKRFQIEINGELLPVRSSTQHFLSAINRYRVNQFKRDNQIKDLWDIQSATINPLMWIKPHGFEQVEVTLFSNKCNELTSAQLYVFGKKAGMNIDEIECFAFTSLKAERLVLDYFIALLHVKAQTINESDLDQTLSSLCEQYLTLFAGTFNDFTNQLQHIKQKYQAIALHLNESSYFSGEDEVRHNQLSKLYERISASQLDKEDECLYELKESDQEIAVIIATYKEYHETITKVIREQVVQIIDQEISQNRLFPLQYIDPMQQYVIALTGSVASGKSTAEQLARELINKNESTVFISSDVYNGSLLKILNLKHYKKHGSSLTLGEMWFIKEIINQELNELYKNNLTLNIIQEAMSPSSVNFPTNATKIVFITTATPQPGLARAEIRGHKQGRFVSGAGTFSSYRLPWHNLLSHLEKTQNEQQCFVYVIDTDLYTKRAPFTINNASNCGIIIYQNKILNISNLLRFISLVNRGYMIHPEPTSQNRWLIGRMDLNLFRLEVKKLFALPIEIQFQGTPIEFEEFMVLVNNALNDNTNRVARFFKQALAVRNLQIEKENPSPTIY